MPKEDQRRCREAPETNQQTLTGMLHRSHIQHTAHHTHRHTQHETTQTDTHMTNVPVCVRECDIVKDGSFVGAAGRHYTQTHNNLCLLSTTQHRLDTAAIRLLVQMGMVMVLTQQTAICGFAVFCDRGVKCWSVSCCGHSQHTTTRVLSLPPRQGWLDPSGPLDSTSRSPLPAHHRTLSTPKHPQTPNSPQTIPDHHRR